MISNRDIHCEDCEIKNLCIYQTLTTEQKQILNSKKIGILKKEGDHLFDQADFAQVLFIVRQGLIKHKKKIGEQEHVFSNFNYLIKLVLLDIHMPVLSGLEALKVVKSNDTLKHVPIVMLANTQTPEDITQSYHLGANSFIFKSIDFKQFKADIDVLLDYWFIYNQTVSCI